ncbi:Muc19 precursor [Myxococcus hansupus]|uniref:Muc19 n=1 Tax=Pseudomyxococcus hansupus TaxID=1297742 RepID=A0A0H4WRS2_9BACT|nr:Muc19 precursor [Myxococcus hansupus]
MDVSKPADIEEAFLPLEVSGAATDIAMGGSLLFVGDAEGVKVFDLADGSRRPLRVGSRVIPGGVSAMALHRGNLLVSSASVGAPLLHVLDARTGGLSTHGTVSLSAPAVHITVEGTRAFVSLGKAKQVAIYQLFDIQNPAPAGTLTVDGLVGGWASAEQTRVAGGVAYVAAGGGKVLRFSVREGETPVQLGRATVVGDARTLAFMGRYLLVGTLVLDKSGTPVELPVSDPADASLPLAGALASVELDTLDIRGTHPRDGEVVSPGESAQVLLTALPEATSATEVTLYRRTPEEMVSVARQVLPDVQGGQVVLTPYSPLALDTAYELRIGAGLKDLRGATLGTEGRVRFRTSLDASPERPEIASVTPAYGLTAGGNEVELLGSGFRSGCTVTIGGIPAPIQELASDGSRMRVLAPAGLAGAAAVEVTNPGGLSHLLLGAYRYLVAPVLTDVQPRHATFNSRAVVRVTGEGLFPGSQVHFDTVPAHSVVMDDSGALLVTVPDQVIGRVALTVLTPGANPQQGTLQGGFTFSLAERTRLNDMGSVLARRGNLVFAAHTDRSLSVVDFAVAGSPGVLGSAVNGVSGPVDMVIHGDDLFLAGRSEVVRYSIAENVCGTSPSAPCSPLELERVQFALAPNVGLRAVAAGGAGAYVAVAGGNELALMSPINGAYEVIARTSLGSGTVIDLDVVDDALLVLVQDGTQSRLEVRSTEGSALPLLGEIPRLGSPMGGMAREGSRVAVSAGTQLHLIDVTHGSEPQILASAVDPNGGSSETLTLSGPWLLASKGSRVSWLDTSQGSTLVERTFASMGSSVSSAAIVNGVAVVSVANSLRVLDVPYPTVDALRPLPGAAIARNGSVAVGLPTALPGAVLSGSTLQLWAGALQVVGNTVPSGTALTFVPSNPLDSERTYVARLVLAPLPSVTGGRLLAPWEYPLRAGGVPMSLRVDAVSPASGPVAGGIPVTVSGFGFGTAPKVLFGGVEAVIVGEVQDNLLTVTLPPSVAAGPAVVRVVRGDGASAVAVTPFVYAAPMSFVDVTPRTVDVAGGWVTISGVGFHHGLEVRFDGAVASTQANRATSVQAHVPSGGLGHLTLTLSQLGSDSVVVPNAVYRGDVRAPEWERIEPLDTISNTNVPLTSVFDLRFDEPLSTASAGLLQLRLHPSGVPVPGVSQLLADGRTLRFTPAESLRSTTYYAVTATGVTDVAGNVARVYTRSFRTLDIVKPTVEIRRLGGAIVVNQDSFAAGVNWTFQVVGTDDSGPVVTTALSVNDMPVPRSPSGHFVYQWHQDEVNTCQVLKATATDSSGNISDTFSVVVQVVEDSPPEVDIEQPAADMSIEEGGSVSVVVVARDSSSVTSVEFHVDGVPMARLAGQTGTLVTLSRSIPLGLLKGSATSEQRVMTAYATDNKGQVTAAAPRTLTVTRDSVPPSVVMRTPVTGAQVVGGSNLMIEALASDENAVTEVEVFVNGASVGLAHTPPWRVSWQAPFVSNPEPHVVRVVARDFRANEGDATAAFTVVPSPTRPFAAITSPDAGTTLPEGKPFGVTVNATAAVAIASVRVTAGTDERVLTQPPWQAEFVAPVLDGGTVPLELTAQVTDEAGMSSHISRVQINVADDGQSHIGVALVREPSGPLLLGGTALTLKGETDGGVTPELSASLGDSPMALRHLPGASLAEARLPEGPEGASVVMRATVQAPGGASAVAEQNGTLAVMTTGQARIVEDASDVLEPVVLASRGDQILVVRSDGGGTGELELRTRQAGARVASQRFTGTPVGAVFVGDEIVVAIRKQGAGALERFTLPALIHKPLESVPLVREPHAVDGARNWIAVATDQGIELRHANGAVASQLSLGNVTALAAEGQRIFATTTTEVVAIDVPMASAPRELARTAIEEAPITTIAALADGGACVAGNVVRCFSLVEAEHSATHLLSRGTAPLNSEALSASAFGELLVVGSRDGVRVIDVRGTPMSAGMYPALMGRAALVPGALVTGTSKGVSYLPVVRGSATPHVDLNLPATVPQGTRVPMSALVSDDALPLNGFTAAVAINGVVAETRDTRLPPWIDMPMTGASASVELAVRDLAGRHVVIQREVLLSESGQESGPAIANVIVPTEVGEGAYFSFVVFPEHPAQVDRVEVSVAGGDPVLFVAPGLAGELLAPEVPAGAPSEVQVTFVALTAQGTRGPPLTRTVLVHDGAAAQRPVIATLRRANASPIYEGARVPIEVAVASTTGGESILLRVDGQEAGRVSGGHAIVPVRIPFGGGTRTVTVTAVARNGAGLESEPATLALNVVNDVTPPTIVAIHTDPSGEYVSAGSEMTASVSATDDDAVESVSLELSIDEVRHARGGWELVYRIPPDLPQGTVLTLRARVEDRAGNVSTQELTRTVTGAVVLHSLANVALESASRLARLGDRVYVATSTGLWIGQLGGSTEAPLLSTLGTLTTPKAPVGVAVLDQLVALAIEDEGLWLIDASVPASPKVVSRVSGTFTGVSASDKFYVLRKPISTQYQVHSIDVSDPSSPVLAVYVNASSERRVLVEANSDGPVFIQGTSKIQVPIVYGTGNASNHVFDVGPALARAAERDGDLVVIGTDRSLHAFVGDALSRTQVPTPVVSVPSGVRALEVVRGIAYVVSDDGWLQLVDYREPLAPKVMSRIRFEAHAVQIGGGLLLSTSTSGVHVTRLSRSGEGIAAGSVHVGDSALGLAPFRGGALVAARSSGTRPVDVSGGRAPQLRNPSEPGSNVRQVESWQRSVFSLDGQAIRVSGVNEVLGGRLQLHGANSSALQQALGAVEQFSVAPGRVWAISSAGGVSTVRWPLTPVPDRQSLALGRAAFGIAGNERRALVALGEQGVAVLEVAPSGQLRHQGILPVSASVVALDGNLAVTGGANSISLFNLGSDGAPQLIGTLPTAGEVQRIRLEGRLAIVSEGAAGVEVWHIHEGEPAERLALLSASSAQDAVFTSGRILIADGDSGLVHSYTAPHSATPTVRILSDGGRLEAEAGGQINLTGIAHGVGIDDAVLVINGHAATHLDEADLRASWTLPNNAVPGSVYSIQIRVYDAGGLTATSQPVEVFVVPSSATHPSVSVSAGGHSTLYSGAVVDVIANKNNGLPPFTVSARLGTAYLGTLQQTATNVNRFEGSFRIPIFESSGSMPLAVILTDGAGRTAEAFVNLNVVGDTQPPGTPSGLPPELRAGPYVHQLTLRGSDDGMHWLELEQDGRLIAVSPERTGSIAFQYSLRLPDDAVGQTITLALTGVDQAGRRTRITQSYIVLPDGSAPTVTFPYGLPHLSAKEGETISVNPSANDVDRDLASIHVYADGVEIGSTTSSSVLIRHTLPRLSERPHVVFKAVATDSRGRTATVERTTVLLPNPPPTFNSSVLPSQPIQRDTVKVCARAFDDVSIVDLVASVDGVAMTEPGSCFTQACRELCGTITLSATATQLEIAASATDNLGATTNLARIIPVGVNRPPNVTLNAQTYMLVGQPREFLGNATDERNTLAWAEFRVNGVAVGDRLISPTSGSSLRRTYTPVSSGMARVSLVAQDQHGQVSESFQDVVVLDARYPADSTPVISAEDLSFEGQDIIVRSGQTLQIDGTHTFRNLYVLQNAVVTHAPQANAGTHFLDLTVSNEVRIYATGKVDVSGRGYLGGWQPGNSDRNGKKQGNAPTGADSAAGSHGGYGQGLAQAGVESPVPIYGDYRDPSEPGSGGSGGAATSALGGNGGGLIRLQAASIRLDGELLANAESGSTNNASYGGAGGGIRIDVGALTGTGAIRANGAGRSAPYGGGGGRVAIYYNSETTAFDWSKVEAKGQYANAGTVFLKGNAQEYGELVLATYTGNSLQFTNRAKPTPVDGGTFDRFNLYGHGDVEVMGPLTTPVLEIERGVRVTFHGEVTGSMESIRVLGGSQVTLRQPWAFLPGVSVELAGVLSVAGGAPLHLSSLSLTQNASALKQVRSTDGLPQPLEVFVNGHVDLVTGSSIDVTGLGYLGGWQEGNESRTGLTYGNQSTGVESAGGSHGGYGRTEQHLTEVAPVATYGDYKLPSTFGTGGSGGPANPSGTPPLGGNGGGALHLKANSIRVNGLLLANASPGTGALASGGAGGSILLETGALTGTGRIEARAASNYGGGGRVAIYYDMSTSTFSLNNVHAPGSNNGGAGTIYLKALQAAHGDIVFDNGGTSFDPLRSKPTELFATPAGEQTFRNFTVKGRAVVFTPDALEVTGTLTVESTSRLQSQNIIRP